MNVLCLVQNRTGIIDWSSLPMQCGGYETLGFDPDPAMHLDSEPDIKLSYTFTLQDLGFTQSSQLHAQICPLFGLIFKMVHVCLHIFTYFYCRNHPTRFGSGSGTEKQVWIQISVLENLLATLDTL